MSRLLPGGSTAGTWQHRQMPGYQSSGEFVKTLLLSLVRIQSTYPTDGGNCIAIIFF